MGGAALETGFGWMAGRGSSTEEAWRVTRRSGAASRLTAKMRDDGDSSCEDRLILGALRPEPGLGLF